jgi:hypothetical protein
MLKRNTLNAVDLPGKLGFSTAAVYVVVFCAIRFEAGRISASRCHCVARCNWSLQLQI